jgi:uncharacterized glyoxalase superfamily protein PhnB
MPAQRAVPVLRVIDVGRSLAWYREVLGFVGDPFPDKAPYRFAILRHGSAELMLRAAAPQGPPVRASYDWDVYLRLEGEPMRDLCARLAARGVVTRRLERMPYGVAEFEITDPDGYTLCLAQVLQEGDEDLPTPEG